MMNYTKRDITAAFSQINKQVTTAANKAYASLTLNDKPALLSFDDTETDRVTYDLIKGQKVSAVITAPNVVAATMTAEQLAQQLASDFQQKLEENVK